MISRLKTQLDKIEITSMTPDQMNQVYHIPINYGSDLVYSAHENENLISISENKNINAHSTFMTTSSFNDETAHLFLANHSSLYYNNEGAGKDTAATLSTDGLYINEQIEGINIAKPFSHDDMISGVLDAEYSRIKEHLEMLNDHISSANNFVSGKLLSNSASFRFLDNDTSDNFGKTGGIK